MSSPPLNFSQLQQIYTRQVTNWSQVGGADAQIVPVLPQAGSGIRATWLAALGIPSTTVEPCWINGTDPFSTANPGPPVEENTGVSIGNHDVFDHSGSFYWPLNQTTTKADSADEIFPYSIGNWIAQGPRVQGTGAAGTPGGAIVGGYSTPVWGHGNLRQGEVVDDFGGTDAPESTNSFGQPVINPNWTPEFFLTLYAVTRNGGTASTPAFPTTPAYDATGLPRLFGPNGWACASNTAQSDIVSAGFDVRVNQVVVRPVPPCHSSKPVSTSIRYHNEEGHGQRPSQLLQWLFVASTPDTHCCPLYSWGLLCLLPNFVRKR